MRITVHININVVKSENDSNFYVHSTFTAALHMCGFKNFGTSNIFMYARTCIYMLTAYVSCKILIEITCNEKCSINKADITVD